MNRPVVFTEVDTLCFYLMINLRLTLASAVARGSVFSFLVEAERAVKSLQKVHGISAKDQELASSFYWVAYKYGTELSQAIDEESLAPDLKRELRRTISKLETQHKEHERIYCTRQKKWIPAEDWVLSDSPAARKAFETIDELTGLTEDLMSKPTAEQLRERLKARFGNKLRTGAQSLAVNSLSPESTANKAARVAPPQKASPKPISNAKTAIKTMADKARKK